MNLKYVVPALFLSLAVTSANAITIAAFSNPSAGSPPLFTVTSTTVDASWLSTGLTLNVPGGVGGPYTDVKMQLDAPVTRSGITLGAGTFRFWTTDINNPIFTMTFDGGTIVEPFVGGASEFSGNVISFGGSAVPNAGNFVNEQFAFSFANPTNMGGGVHTYTASMDSSADVVPEPATLTLLAAGLAGFVVRRKRSS